MSERTWTQSEIQAALDQAARGGEEYTYATESSFLGPNVRKSVTSRRGDLYDMAHNVIGALLRQREVGR